MDTNYLRHGGHVCLSSVSKFTQESCKKISMKFELWQTYTNTNIRSKLITSVLIQNIIVIIIFALVLHSQCLRISKCKNVCPEWLGWGLGNRERVGKAHCVETLNCH